MSTENLDDCWEKLKKIYTKGEMYCVHGLENLNLL